MSPAAQCLHCGAAQVTATAKFCAECGTPVTPAEQAPEIRKTVTLLFTDVTGSTALGEALDPEALRGVMGRYFEVARAAVERHGGMVEKFVGDAVLAVFGLPEVREDDALRAVRAAADLQAGMAELADELTATQGVTLAIRTGINTGPVVTGTDRAGGSFATGDAVNTAARLEQAARPGEVLLGQPTYDLVRDAVEVEEVEPVAAKGKAEPVRAHRLVSVDAAAAGRARRPDAPLVGREREVRALQDALDRTIELGRGHLVTVTGAPGIGKTRMVAEFLDQAAREAMVLSGRCVSYGIGITYFPFVQILREGAGLSGTESPEVTRYAVAAVLRDLALGPQLTDLLMPLLGAGGEQGSDDATHEAIIRFLEQLALLGPVVLQVDDLHWAEPPLVDLLESVRRETADLPLLLVGQARPEFLEHHPGWGQGATNNVTIGLEPFGHEDTAASMSAILGSKVPAEVEQAVTRWSGGNPLFVEEIAAHLRETGTLTLRDGQWALVRDLSSAGVPVTISALLDARLERLPAQERRVLQAVSVAGLEANAPEAGVLAGDGASDADLAGALTSLARRDFLRRVRGAAQETWAFRHVLIRDAAYGALSKSERTRLHTALADHLQARLDAHDAAAAGGELLAFIAHHRLQAAQHAHELAPHSSQTSTLADLAGLAALRCADELASGKSVLRHDEALVAALKLPVTIAVRRRLLLTRLVQCEQYYLVDQIEEILDALERTFEDGESSTLERQCLQMNRLSLRIYQSASVEPRELREVAEGVRQMASAADDSLRSQLAVMALGNGYAMEATWAPILDLLDAQQAGRRRSMADMLHEWRMAAMLHGPTPMSTLAERARAAAAEAVTTPERAARDIEALVAELAIGDPAAAQAADERLTQARAVLRDRPAYQILVAHALELLGRDDEAAATIESVVTAMASRGDTAHASTYLAKQALQEHEAGAGVERVEELTEKAASWTSPHDVMSVALVACGRALIASRGGLRQEARRHARTALKTIDRSDQSWEAAWMRRLLADVPRASGDAVLERRLLAEAHALYAAKGITAWQSRIEARLGELDLTR